MVNWLNTKTYINEYWSNISLLHQSLCLGITTVLGVPHYVAIPLDDFERMGLVSEPIYGADSSIPEEDLEPEMAASSVENSYFEAIAEASVGDDRSKRDSGGHGDVVDYGAYTGHKGAFGWYTDHPVGGHHR